MKGQVQKVVTLSAVLSFAGACISYADGLSADPRQTTEQQLQREMPGQSPQEVARQRRSNQVWLQQQRALLAENSQPESRFQISEETPTSRRLVKETAKQRITVKLGYLVVPAPNRERVAVHENVFDKEISRDTIVTSKLIDVVGNRLGNALFEYQKTGPTRQDERYENVQFIDPETEGLAAQFLRDVVRDAPSVPAEQEPTPTGFVSRLYETVLGRPADPGGLAFWVGRLNAGASRGQVRAAIENSGEDRGRYVDQLYQEVLGRPAEPAGRAHWVDALNSGWSRARVREAIATSDESRGRISGLYKEILRREVDQGGERHWMRFLASGGTTTQVRFGIATSPEARRLVEAEYQQTLHRAPSSQEIQSHLDVLAAGWTLEQVRGGIRQGNEARAVGIYLSVLGNLPSREEQRAARDALAAGTTPEQLRRQVAFGQRSTDRVTGIYRDIVDRPVDHDTLRQLQESLASGASHQEVRRTIAFSDASRANVRMVFENELGQAASEERVEQALNDLAAGRMFQEVRLNIHRSVLRYPPVGSALNRTISFQTNPSTRRILGYTGQETNNEIVFTYLSNPFGFHGASTFDGIPRARYSHEADLTGRYVYDDQGRLLRVEETAVIRRWTPSRTFVESRDARTIYRPRVR